mgnify:FL=1
MNRKMRRMSEAEGKRRQKKEWNEFQDVIQEAIKRNLLFNPDSTFRPDRVFMNNRYIVQVFTNKMRNFKLYDKILIRRSDSKPIYSWQDLFRIKNEIFGPEVEAIQFFPPVSKLVDEANLYWLWSEVKNK